MKKILHCIMLLGAFLFARNIFSMNQVVQYKDIELTQEQRLIIEADPEAMRLQNDLAFIDSEINSIDNKIYGKKSFKKKSDVSIKESSEKVRIPVTDALNAFLPCYQRFDNFKELLHKAKFEKTTTLNEDEFKEALRKSKNKPDKIARYMSKKFDIYGTNATSGFDFNKNHKQSISHWIFRGGLDQYYTSNGIVSQDSKKLAIFHSLRALKIWGADLDQDCSDKRDYRGNTPLHCAAKSSNCDAVKYLCEIGVNVNVQNAKGTIPLLALVLQRQKIVGSVERCIAALSKAGSDLTIKNLKNKSVESEIVDIKKQKALPGDSFSTLLPFTLEPDITYITCRLDTVIRNSLQTVSDTVAG